MSIYMRYFRLKERKEQMLEYPMVLYYKDTHTNTSFELLNLYLFCDVQALS